MNKVAVSRKIERFLCLALFFSISITIQAQDAADIVYKLVKATKSYETISFEMEKTERFGKKYKPGNFRIKCREKPLAVYTYTVDKPSPGAELLWNKGWDEVMVHKASFPSMTLNLSLFNYLITKDSHHPIYHSSFRYFGGILDHLISKYADRTDELVSIAGDVFYNGEQCYIVEMATDNFRIVEHTVDRKELMNDFAERKFISAYKIKELNGIDYDDYLKPGKTIKITNDYAQKMTLHISKKTYLPIRLEIHDEKGLLEQFDYSNIKVNVPFAQDEFSEDFEEYGF